MRSRAGRGIGRTGAGLVALSLALVACTGGGDEPSGTAPTSTTAATNTSVGDRPSTTDDETQATTPPAPIDWRSCGTAESATVTVPLDHDRPEGSTIELAVARLPATGDRIGPLFVNFGGPGAGSVDRLDTFRVPGAIRSSIDIVAIDPRGVGGSEAFDCGLDPTTLYALDPTFEDPIDRATYVDVSHRYVEDCATTEADLLPHLGTRQVARDMDLVRAAMGDATLNYLGYSYGTVIGQVYADLFPNGVRAMVLDGVVDPAASGIDAAVDQGLGSEQALARWAEGCSDRPTCRFRDPLGAVDDVLALSESEIASSSGTRPAGRGEAHTGITYTLYAERLWPELDVALAEAIDGDGRSLVSLADRYAALTDFAVYFGVSCLDAAWPRDVDAFVARAEGAAEAAPRFGTPTVIDYLRCAIWPAVPSPIGPIAAPGAGPILVVSTTGDPVTPHQQAIRVAERLDGGALLTHEGDGHAITYGGVACVDAVVDALLLDLATPEPGATCP